MLTANVEYKFKATHWIPGHPTCGKAHKHDWRIRVGVMRRPGFKPLEDGMVIDFKELLGMVRRVIKNAGPVLNDYVPIPTCENLLEGWIVPELRKTLRADAGREGPEELELVRVELWENEKYYCEWVK